jgi:DNA primase
LLYLAVLTFWCAGFRHVTASYGVNGFTDDHRAACKKYRTQRIYIAYDRDDAGERAAEKLAEELLAMGIECFRVQFPKNMDANDYALKVTPANTILLADASLNPRPQARAFLLTTATTSSKKQIPPGLSLPATRRG